jgi:hypothetical protein
MEVLYCAEQLVVCVAYSLVEFLFLSFPFFPFFPFFSFLFLFHVFYAFSFGCLFFPF